MNIAVITREISGLTKNGGIGTAVRYLCEHLASHGEHEVHMYYTGRPSLHMSRLKKELAARDIVLHSIPLLAQSLTKDYRKKPRYIYTALSTTKHEMYLFHEFMADGFFCLQAKKNKAAFTTTPLGIVTHGSSLWVDHGNGCPSQEPRRLQLYDMEKTCCELADFLISPSEYLLDWMRGQDWRLPRISCCIPNFTSAPRKNLFVFPKKQLTGQEVRELVFFGRLEERKGVKIFCDAINMLSPHLLAGRSITFLGKEAHFSTETIRSWLSPALNKTRFSLYFFTKYDSLEARKYLSRDGVLAVMPSLRENSPCTVSECLEEGIPFIASSVGGGKELVQEEDREKAFFPPQSENLAHRLKVILESTGASGSSPAWTGEDIYKSWQSILQNVTR